MKKLVNHIKQSRNRLRQFSSILEALIVDFAIFPEVGKVSNLTCAVKHWRLATRASGTPTTHGSKANIPDSYILKIKLYRKKILM